MENQQVIDSQDFARFMIWCKRLDCNPLDVVGHGEGPILNDRGGPCEECMRQTPPVDNVALRWFGLVAKDMSARRNRVARLCIHHHDEAKHKIAEHVLYLRDLLPK